MPPTASTRRPTVIDLFAGAGGTGLGFLRTGYQILAAVEIDADAAATYERNLGVQVWKQDIREISPAEMADRLGPVSKRPDVDVLVGCPPCQGFTRMRNRAGAEDARNELIFEYLEFVRVLRPRFLVFENVPGLIFSAHGKAYHRALLCGIREMGYAVEEFYLDAADFGVPQHRRRVIVLGGRDGEMPPDLSARRTHGDPASPEVHAGKLRPWRTVRDALAHLPPLAPGEVSPHDPMHRAPGMKRRVAEFIAMVPPDGGSRLDVPETYWPACHRGHAGHYDTYGRMAWDRPANVITSGCCNVSKGRFVHPEQNRAITPREAALLQGFPPDYMFVGSMESVRRQIGNAVPPPLAEAVALALKERLIPSAHRRTHTGDAEDTGRIGGPEADR